MKKPTQRKRLWCRIFGHNYGERHWNDMPESTGMFGGLVIKWQEKCSRCDFINSGFDKWD